MGLTSDQRKKLKENKSESDTLKNGHGDGNDINHLFAAMLNSAGLDARIANVTQRSNPRFNPKLFNGYLIESEVVAVKLPDGWKFYEPASQHLPFGMLIWTKEDQTVLISDEKTPVWDKTPSAFLKTQYTRERCV